MANSRMYSISGMTNSSMAYSMTNSSMVSNSMCNWSHMVGGVYSCLCVGGSTDFTGNLLLHRVAHFSRYWVAHLSWYSMANLSWYWNLDDIADLTGNSNADLSWHITGSLDWNLMTLPFSGSFADRCSMDYLAISMRIGISIWGGISITLTMMMTSSGMSNNFMTNSSMSYSSMSNSRMSNGNRCNSSMSMNSSGNRCYNSNWCNSMAYSMSYHRRRSMDLCGSLSTVLSNNILALFNMGGINDGVSFSVASLFSYCVALLLWPMIGDCLANLLRHSLASLFGDGLASLANSHIIFSVTLRGVGNGSYGYSCVSNSRVSAVSVMTIVSIRVSSCIGISVTFD